MQFTHNCTNRECKSIDKRVNKRINKQDKSAEREGDTGKTKQLHHFCRALLMGGGGGGAGREVVRAAGSEAVSGSERVNCFQGNTFLPRSLAWSTILSSKREAEAK